MGKTKYLYLLILGVIILAGFLLAGPVKATVISEGDLVKTPEISAVYLIQEGKRRVFPHIAVYLSWDYPEDFHTVKVVPSLADYPEGNPIPLRDGSLFRGRAVSLYGREASCVFFVSAGKLKEIKSGEIYQELFNDPAWKKVIWVPDDLLDKFKYPIGDMIETPDIHPDGSLVRYAGQLGIYLIEEGKKRPITKKEAFEDNHFKWEDVIEIPPTEVYPDGSIIDRLEDRLVIPPSVVIIIIAPEANVPDVPELYDPGEFVKFGDPFMIDWSSVPNALVFILERDIDPSFTKPMEIYGGVLSQYTEFLEPDVDMTYYFRVHGKNTAGASGYSNVVDMKVIATIKPVHKRIEVSHPNGGEELRQGDCYPIEWKASDIARVDIDLLTRAEKYPEIYEVTRVAAGIKADQGNYKWCIPTKIPLHEYACHKISIVESVGYWQPIETAVASDESDSCFSIIKEILPPVPPPPVETDLEIRDVIKADFHPYGFFLNTCIHGSKSINDLKGEIGGLSDFPFAYEVIDIDGIGYYRYMGAGGSIEQRKNGECETFGWTIQLADQKVFDRSGKVKVILDPNHLIKESNEYNNTFFFQPAYVKCVRDEVARGVKCGGYFYEDYCEYMPDGVPSWANIRKCYAPEGKSCSTLVGVDRIPCDWKCEKGECIKAPLITCKDTDGGRDYYTAGSVYTCKEGVCILPIRDSCIDEFTLIEGYCENGNMLFERYWCLYGCKDGACIKAPPVEPCPTDCQCLEETPDLPLCHGKKTVCEEVNGRVKYCYERPIEPCPTNCLCLTEADAAAQGLTLCGGKIIVCERSLGAPVKYCYEPRPIVCKDTDWFGQGDAEHLKRLETKGTCTDSTGSYTDVCVGDGMLKDYTCEPLLQEPKSCGYTTYNCLAYGFTGCADGACYKAPEKRITVISPNGGEIWYEGETHQIKWESAGVDSVHLKCFIEYVDGNSEETLIKELSTNPGYYDWSIPKAFSQTGVKFWIKVMDPVSFVSDMSDDYFKISPAPAVCQDTDWFGQGDAEHLKRLETKGTCTDSTGNYTDVCVDEKQLRDYTCEPLLQEPKSCGYTTYNCPGYGYTGCKDGACYKVAPPEAKPDLQVTDIVWSPANPKQNESVNFQFTVKNNGNVAVQSAWWYIWYNVVNGTAGGLGQYSQASNGGSVGYLGPGETVTIKSPSLGAQVYPKVGTYTVRANVYDASPAESDATNNMREETISIGAVNPDLQVTDIAWSPASPKEDESVSFQFTIKNIGDATAQSAWWYIWYNVVNNTAGGLGQYSQASNGGSITNLGPGESIIIQAPSLGAQVYPDPGTYTVRANVYDSTPAETNTANNMREEQISIGVAKPDLKVTDISWSPTSPKEDESVSFQFTVKNNGNVAVQSAWWYIWYNVVNGTAGGLGQYSQASNGGSVGYLGPGETVTIKSPSLGAQVYPDPGTYTVRANVYNSTPAESDTANNMREEQIIIAAVKPDLSVTDIVWSPTSPKQNEAVNFQFTIKNNGNGAVQSAWWYIWYNVVNGTAGSLGGVQASNGGSLGYLGPGESTTIQAPSLGAQYYPDPGTYTVRANVYNSTPAESDTANNMREEQISITAVKPDLQVTDIAWSPASPKEDESVSFQFTIKNIGNATAQSAWWYIWYNVVNGTAGSLGGVQASNGGSISNLAPGDSITIASPNLGTMYYPDAGTYTVRANVYDSTPTESNTTNNMREEQIVIAPIKSITVTSPNGGEQWIKGSTYNVTWTSSGIGYVHIDVIQYPTGAGARAYTLVSNVPAAQGSWSWTIGAIWPDIVPGDNWKMRVSEYPFTDLYDIGDNYFSIIVPD